LEQPSGFGPFEPPAPPKKRRGLKIAAIVLAVVFLLCAGGGTVAYFVLVRNSDHRGADNPSQAVNDFLVAVYADKDVTKANALVCLQARRRDDVTRKVNEVKQIGQQYKEPTFSWDDPTVTETKKDSATVDVKIKISTADEKIAEQALKIIVVRKSGWFVCEVQPG
jgi:flagellar basal body-associated protein FliL